MTKQEFKDWVSSIDSKLLSAFRSTFDRDIEPTDSIEIHETALFNIMSCGAQVFALVSLEGKVYIPSECGFTKRVFWIDDKLVERD